MIDTIDDGVLLRKAKTKKMLSEDGIDYTYFRDNGRHVFYIYETNEPKDWAWNLLYIGLFYHLGFYIKAKKMIELIHTYSVDEYILIGHSHGAAVASIVYAKERKRITKCILTGCPASYTILNPFFPGKKMHSYLSSNDIVGKSSVMFPFFRQPKKPIVIKTKEKNPIKSHLIYQDIL